MYNRSSWSFDSKVALEFESHVRKNLPFYDELQRMVVALSDYYIHQDATVYDIGCATGETISRLYARHTQKNLHFIGVDSSTEMLEKAKIKLSDGPQTTFIPSPIEQVEFTKPSPLIYSILTMHFIPIYQREIIFQKIYNSLVRGGAFVLVDKVYASTPFTQQLFTHMHYDEKREAGFTADEIILKEESLRGVMQPIALQTLLDLLRRIGFECEIFFKHWQFTGVLAIKPV